MIKQFPNTRRDSTYPGRFIVDPAKFPDEEQKYVVVEYAIVNGQEVAGQLHGYTTTKKEAVNLIGKIKKEGTQRWG